MFEAVATTESHAILQNIMKQCHLVYPLTSSKEEKRKMVKRLVFNWHPDKATVMGVDSKVCNEVTRWLLRLLDVVYLG